MRPAPDALRWLAGAGACFLAAAAVTAGRVAWTGTLRVERGGWWVWFGTLLLLGLPLAAAAGCCLRALRDAPVAPTRRLLLGCLALHVLAWPALPITSNDVFSNLAYGRMARAGLDPFRAGPAALGPGDAILPLITPRWLEAPSPYGPVALAVSAFGARARSVVGQLFLFKGVMLAVALATVAIAFRIARHQPGQEQGRRALLLAGSPLLAWEVSSQAHNDGLMVLALAAFVWAALEARPWLALALAAVAVACKGAALPVLGLYGIWLLRQRQTRWPALGALGAVALLAVAVRPRGLLDALRAPLAASGAFDPSRHTRSLADAVTLTAAILGHRIQDGTYYAFWALHVLAVAAVFAVCAWRARTVASVFRGSLLVLLTFLWTTPWAQPWYGTWVLPFVAVEEDRTLRLAAVLYTFLLVVQYGLALDPITYLLVDGLPLALLYRAWKRRPLPSVPLAV